jgi:protein disulfide-isomerase A1
VSRQLAPVPKKLEAGEIDTFPGEENVAVLGIFASYESDEYKTFVEVATKLREDYVFAATDREEDRKKIYAEAPSVVLFKKFDEGRNELVGAEGFAAESLTSWIKTHATPLMDDIGPQNYAGFIESGVPLAYLFIDSDEQRTEIGAQVREIAKKYKGKVNFVFCDAKKYGGHARNLNLKEEFPAFAIQSTGGEKVLKYPLSQASHITADAIEKFVESFVAGEVEPSVKSEEIPETNDGPVKVVVGKNFNEIVQDPTKDVLIEFYAPCTCFFSFFFFSGFFFVFVFFVLQRHRNQPVLLFFLFFFVSFS